MMKTFSIFTSLVLLNLDVQQFIPGCFGDFEVSLGIKQFNNEYGRLEDKANCDFAGECDIQMEICVELQGGANNDLSTCRTELNSFLSTGVIADNVDSPTLQNDTIYGQWTNPFVFVGKGVFTGFNFKDKVADADVFGSDIVANIAHYFPATEVGINEEQAANIEISQLHSCLPDPESTSCISNTATTATSSSTTTSTTTKDITNFKVEFGIIKFHNPNGLINDGNVCDATSDCDTKMEICVESAASDSCQERFSADNSFEVCLQKGGFISTGIIADNDNSPRLQLNTAYDLWQNPSEYDNGGLYRGINFKVKVTDGDSFGGDDSIVNLTKFYSSERYGINYYHVDRIQEPELQRFGIDVQFKVYCWPDIESTSCISEQDTATTTPSTTPSTTPTPTTISAKFKIIFGIKQFHNPNGLINDGNNCDFLNDCDTMMDICVEAAASADNNFEVCQQRDGFINTATIANDVNSPVLEVNTEYNEWSNPNNYENDGLFRGINIKVKVVDTDLVGPNDSIVNLAKFYSPEVYSLNQDHVDRIEEPELKRFSIDVFFKVYCWPDVESTSCAPSGENATSATTPAPPTTPSPQSSTITTQPTTPSPPSSTTTPPPITPSPPPSSTTATQPPTDPCTTPDLGESTTAVDCADIKADRPDVTSGPYRILNPIKDGVERTIVVFCDFDTADMAWTVIQRRVSDRTSFDLDFYQYEHGFGDLCNNFWLGLKVIQALTENQHLNQLRIDLEDCHYKTAFAKFNGFTISGDDYILNTGQYDRSSTAGDSFNYIKSNGDTEYLQNGTFFKTRDMGNHGLCARALEGGWWHSNTPEIEKCGAAHLNGVYKPIEQFPHCRYFGKFPNGISWQTWRSGRISAKYAYMKLRNAEKGF